MKTSQADSLFSKSADSFLPWRVIWDAERKLRCVSERTFSFLGSEFLGKEEQVPLFRPFRGTLRPAHFDHLLNISIEWGVENKRLIGELYRLADGGWILLGSPSARSVADLRTMGLEPSDLPAHLGFSRLLMAVEAAKISEANSAQLAKKLDEEASKLSVLLDQKEVLLREVHHRVKNNLAVVSSLLTQQSLTLKDHPLAVDAFRKSSARIRAIAMVHRQLYKFDNLEQVDLDVYLMKLLREIRASFDPSYRFEFEMVKVQLLPDRVIPLGLLVNEVAINAIKHASGGSKDSENRRAVAKLRQDGQSLELSVRDWGPGLDDGTSLVRPQSLGGKLIHALARQLRAELTLTNMDPGLEVKLRFPISLEPKP